jgi:hypothetical protein
MITGLHLPRVCCLSDQLWKQVQGGFDWLKARQDLADAEAAYERKKAAEPEKDWRTRDSGGPQMRKAIREMQQAVSAKDVDMLKQALGVLKSELKQ